MKTFLKIVLPALVVLLAIAAVVVFESDFDAAEVDARYANDQSQFLTLADGARIHYRDQGNSDGEPLVLIHGSNASLHTWEPWLQFLGATFRVITVDLPGHGLTGAVPAGDYGGTAQVATVRALAEHLNLNRFVLGGNSMGGGVSWRYALAWPGQVSALILVDASGLWSWRDEDAPQADGKNNKNEGPLVFRLLREPWFQRIAGSLDTRYLTQQGLRSAFHNESLVTDEMVDLYYYMSMRAGTREATLKRFTRLRDQGTQYSDEDIASLDMPTLVLWGETDTLIPTSAGERFAELMPNAELIVYPEVGHLPMEEVAEQSANDVLSFLAARASR